MAFLGQRPQGLGITGEKVRIEEILDSCRVGGVHVHHELLGHGVPTTLTFLCLIREGPDNVSVEVVIQTELVGDGDARRKRHGGT